LVAGLSVVHHHGLERRCADSVAKLCARVLRLQASLSDRLLCRLAHHAGVLAGGAPTRQRTAPGRLLCGLRPQFCLRLSPSPLEEEVRRGRRPPPQEDEDEAAARDEAFRPGDLVMVAHAYAHAATEVADRPLFEALREHLGSDLLLRLSPAELANLANSFGKLSQASSLGHVPLFDRLGRHMLGVAEEAGLRNACVALSAYAQAAVRHEPLFNAFEPLLPGWLHGPGCDTRQLAMLAHAHVRVGLAQSPILPLVWERGARLAQRSDAHGVSVLLFAVTKASAVGPGTSGEVLLEALAARLLTLLRRSRPAATAAAEPPSAGSPSSGGVQPATVAVTAYALARGGCATLVPPVLWQELAVHGAAGLDRLSLTQASNLATALATAAQASEEVREVAAGGSRAFLEALRRRLEAQLLAGGGGGGAGLLLPRPLPAASGAGQASSHLPPVAAAKLIAAFGDLRYMEAGSVVRRLAYGCLLPGRGGSTSEALGVGPLRSVAAALTRLHVHDEDLLQALTAAQRKPQQQQSQSGRGRRRA